MHSARLWIITLCALMLAAMPASAQAPAQEKLPEDVQKAKEKVEDHLKKLNGAGAQIIYLEAASKAFPNQYFFAARYRQFPVARIMPAGLKASNVFAVPKEGDLVHVKDVSELQTFFTKNLAAVKEEGPAKDAVKAALTLTEEFRQDGFFKFTTVDESLKFENKEASGKAVVMSGGNGELAVTLKFNGEGKVTDLTETAKIRPGPRPICQATKLLDADPIVRRMAEQDLLIMGLAAREYIMEQRSKAGPELRQAIDRLWDRIVEAGW